MYNTENVYEQITKPLIDLTKKNTKFLSTSQCQQVCKEIFKTMINRTALRLRSCNPTLTTIHITEVGLKGIESSGYQETTCTGFPSTTQEQTSPSQKYSQTKSPIPNRGT